MTPATVDQPPVIELRGVTKTYDLGEIEVAALRGVDFTIETGEMVAVIGPSGSGKSTLLHLLGGLDQPSQGAVELMGAPLAGLSASDVGLLRNRHLGFVYQFHHLLPEFTAQENVAMPLWIRRDDRAQAAVRANDMLASVGLAERVLHRPSELSGGERQRVALARALVTQPACVLADEPTGNLDRSTAERVWDLMLACARQQGTAFVVVTHDARLAQRCERVLSLQAGRLQAWQV